MAWAAIRRESAGTTKKSQILYAFLKLSYEYACGQGCTLSTLIYNMIILEMFFIYIYLLKGYEVIYTRIKSRRHMF